MTDERGVVRPMRPTAISRSYHAAMTMPTHELVRELNTALGATLVAYMADVRSRQLPHRWATGPDDPTHTQPGGDAEQKLRLAHQAFAVISESEGPGIARAWFIGANPRLDGQSPAERIRAFDGRAVFAAVRALVEDAGGA